MSKATARSLDASKTLSSEVGPAAHVHIRMSANTSRWRKHLPCRDRGAVTLSTFYSRSQCRGTIRRKIWRGCRLLLTHLRGKTEAQGRRCEGVGKQKAGKA